MWWANRIIVISRSLNSRQDVYTFWGPVAIRKYVVCLSICISCRRCNGTAEVCCVMYVIGVTVIHSTSFGLEHRPSKTFTQSQNFFVMTCYFVELILILIDLKYIVINKQNGKISIRKFFFLYF